MKECTVLAYEAPDGKKFSRKEDCLEYEELLAFQDNFGEILTFFSKEDCLKYEELLAFQDNFGKLLKSSGISQEAFSSMVGLSRQQINNIIHKRTKMTKTQYIAFNAVLVYLKADGIELKVTKEAKLC